MGRHAAGLFENPLEMLHGIPDGPGQVGHVQLLRIMLLHEAQRLAEGQLCGRGDRRGGAACQVRPGLPGLGLASGGRFPGCQQQGVELAGIVAFAAFRALVDVLP
ncbi:hypothetical protein D3C81_1999630 [compost metagenome]